VVRGVCWRQDEEVTDKDADANRLSAASLRAGDPTGWFEHLYAAAAEGQAVVPWDRRAPHPLLVDWAAAQPPPGRAHRALVVGCGLGEDAAYLSGLGWGVTAFDISPSAIATARRRFPTVPADFRVADLFNPPEEWAGRFDLVLETYTTQSLPVRLRPTITKHVRRFVAVGGTLLVLAEAEDEHSAAGPPWPLTREEVAAFAGEGLHCVDIEEVRTPPDARQWRAQFERR
jgi:SAM-dependent methyltransferase